MAISNKEKEVVWIVGKQINWYTEGSVWEIQGVFSNEALAVAACRTPLYFVGPLTLNESLPDETVVWEGCYYPSEEN